MSDEKGKFDMKQVADPDTGATDQPDAPQEQSDAPPAAAQAPVHGVLIGVLAELTNEGHPCVNYPGNLAVLPVRARAMTPITEEAIGSDVALLFENGDINKPIVMGIIQSVPGTESENVGDIVETLSPEESGAADTELLIDGKRLDLQAREQIVLRCGKSSITLTSAGKVIIRGAYVSTRSSGANRIKGGSVQIN